MRWRGNMSDSILLQGKVSPWRYKCAISGNEIEITVSHLYTTIRINERCYYFRAENGIFDGTSTDMTFSPFPKIIFLCIVLLLLQAFHILLLIY